MPKRRQLYRRTTITNIVGRYDGKRGRGDIVAAIERERRGNDGATLELLKVLPRQVAEEPGVAAKMIATVDDLEAIAADDEADVAAPRGLAALDFRR